MDPEQEPNHSEKMKRELPRGLPGTSDGVLGGQAVLEEDLPVLLGRVQLVDQTVVPQFGSGRQIDLEVAS